MGVSDCHIKSLAHEEGGRNILPELLHLLDLTRQLLGERLLEGLDNSRSVYSSEDSKAS